MSDPWQAARALVDAAHAADPAGEELTYADRMEAWLERHQAEPPPHLRLAARCQHLERWTLPRSSRPEGREGYLRWRTEQYRRMAERARQLLLAAGVEADAADRVCRLVSKQGLRSDPEAQTIEDCACLVFLAHHLEAFAAAQTEVGRGKLLDIVRKTWRKMGRRGRELALGLPLAPSLAQLVQEAVTGSDGS